MHWLVHVCIVSRALSEIKVEISKIFTIKTVLADKSDRYASEQYENETALGNVERETCTVTVKT